MIFSPTCKNYSFVTQKTDLSNVKFTNARVSNGKFQQATLKNTDFSGASYDSCTFLEADLRGAKNINWQMFRRSSWKHAKITQQEYDSIPLPGEDKQSLDLLIVHLDETVDVQVNAVN